ncbi:MAG: hypothetical protein ACO1OT_06160 [Heyndrickxia sp.]
MIKVKIKTNGRRFFFPIPYISLKLFMGILTSKRIISIANHAIEKEEEKNFQIPYMSKNDLKPILRELSKYKGLQLVDIMLKDGTEVSIKL